MTMKIVKRKATPPARHWLVERPFAHRGLHGPDCPENSLAAILRAVEAGFPLEIDVQATREGVPVVIHDWTLERLAGREGRISEMRLEDLRRARLLGTEEGIPTLQEILEAVNGRVALLIEIKNRGLTGHVENGTANLLRDYQGLFAIQSFNMWTVHWFRTYCPEILRGQLSCQFNTDPMAAWKKVILSHYGMNWLTRPHFLAHRWQDLPSPIPSLSRRLFGLPLLAWTVKSPEEQATATRRADNFIFENYIPREG